MLEIRPFQKHDQQQVVQLILSIQTQEFDIPITLADQPDLQSIVGFYQRQDGNFWVAVYENQVVGTIALLDLGKSLGALRKMFVHPDFRGREWGTAQKLLDGLLSWAQTRRLSEVYLGTTAQFLAAHRFYERNGFKPVEVAALPAAFPVLAVDTRFYVFQVPSKIVL